MRTLLLIVTLLICALPTGVSASDLPSDAPGDHARQPAAVSQPADAPRAEAKVFIHPETKEILTHEQWQALGLENDESEAVPRSLFRRR